MVVLLRRPENIKGMASDVKEAASRVVNDLVAFVQKDGDASKVSIIDWTGKAT